MRALELPAYEEYDDCGKYRGPDTDEGGFQEYYEVRAYARFEEDSHVCDTQVFTENRLGVGGDKTLVRALPCPEITTVRINLS
jgi:hypothetical protein